MPQRVAGAFRIQFAHNLAARADPLAHFHGVVERCEWLGLWPDDPSGKATRHVGASYLKNLAVAFSRDESDARALALEHGIGGNRGPVHQLSERGRLNPGARANALDPGEHRSRLINGRRRHLGAKSFAGVLVD